VDVDLDRDMELLVAVFEQCIRPASSTYWLARCQETDVIRASLDLYVHIDCWALRPSFTLITQTTSLRSSYPSLPHGPRQ
jgi:nuclear pore complex protein Nup188